MNTKPIDAFIPHVAPLAEGVPSFVIRQAVSRTVADMCRVTGCVRTSINFKVKPEQLGFMLVVPAGFLPAQVHHVFVGGVEIQDIRRDELSKRFGGSDWQDSKGAPLYYTFEKPNSMELYPVPDREYPVRVELALQIDSDADQIPEVFYTNYIEAVVCGVLARILQIAGQTYTNPEMALAYQTLYNNRCNDIICEMSRGSTRRTGRVFYNRIV